MTKNNQDLAVIFDFGAVLVDWNPYYLYRKLLKSDEEIKAFLHEISFREWNLNFDKGYPFAKGIEEKCAQFPQYADLIRAFNDHWLDAMGAQLTGTIDILQRLKDKKYPLYGLSNWSVEKFSIVKKDFHFLSLLEDYVISGEVRQVKPYPEIYQTLLTRIGRQAQKCLFIDDSLDNIMGAEKLGFQTILFKNPEQLEKELIDRGLL